MPFPNTDTQFKPGESGNPAGKPKGTKHLSTHIQDLLDDEAFSPEKVSGKEYSGTPMKAIIVTAITKAIDGDNRWADWLAKYGYGEKYTVDQNISGQLDTTPSNPELTERFTQFLKNDTKQ